MTLDAKERSRYEGNPVELYRFAVGATVYRLTSADEDVQSSADGSSQTYSKHPITRKNLRLSQESTSGEIDVTLDAEHALSVLFKYESPAAPVSATIYRLHHNDGQAQVLFTGRIIGATFEPGACLLKCAPLDLRPAIPRLYFQKACNWALYGPGCTLDKADWKESGTILSFGGFGMRAAVFGAFASGYFEKGWVELADLTRRYIVKHVGDLVTLRSPFPTLSVGQAIDVYPGCDRLKETCRDKFSNLPNFSGFPDIPLKNPFTEGMS